MPYQLGQVVEKILVADDHLVVTRAVLLCDSSGEAELVLLVEETELPESSLLVQVNSGGRTATRKFQLRRVGAQ